MDQIDQTMQRAFSAEEWQKWKSALSLAVADETLTVRFPHRFFADWFQRQAQSRFEQALDGTGLRIVYAETRPQAAPPAPTPAPLSQALPFGREFIFDNFLVNNKNSFPLASAQEVAHASDVTYNPFVLCGESGSGKSFLLRAMANARSERNQSIHLSSVTELHDLYSSRQDSRNALLGCDFFAVDDLQEIARYPYLQDELLILFDHFHRERLQMVFTCSGKIARSSFLIPKLKSRLEWGLSVTLKTPDLDIRARYAQSRCREERLELGRDKVLILAQRFSDLRKLEGCLLKLLAYRDLVHDPVPTESFEAILNHFDDRQSTPLSVDQILEAVCTHFDVSREHLLSTGRRHDLVFARQVGIFLCRKHLGLSFPELGQAFGGRDHATALYSYRKIEQLQRDDKSLKTMLQTLIEKCQAMRNPDLA